MDWNNNLNTFPLSPAALQSRLDAEIYPASFSVIDDAALWLMKGAHDKQLGVLAPGGHSWLTKFSGDAQPFNSEYVLKRCPTDHVNSRVLRAVLPHLRPVPLGLKTSAGMGDRLGLATPSHARALASVLAGEHKRDILPIFAQQSIREMSRTNRTPDDVMNDATWGAFEAGWNSPLGADADHLKTPEDIDACAAVGFSFYTFDPGAFVDSEADVAATTELEQKVATLAWRDLDSSPTDLEQRYVGKRLDLEHHEISLTKESVIRAAAKYGGAVAQVTRLYRHLAAKNILFELEVSVDETETPTTHAEHYYIASELKRLDVQWVSLAPRYVGRFEKGVDYIGDLDALRADLTGHAAIARALGPYKLSLHSGSDKFRVYPLIVEAARGVVHLKTAGTSYLEAVRAIARVNPPLFREIAALAVERYPTDRATYHVSADLSRVPPLSTLTDAKLPDLLDQFDARQVLHVTFGSALAKYGDDIKTTLRAHEAEHYAAIERHFIKHLEPFAR